MSVTVCVCVCTCIGLVEQLGQVDHSPLYRRYSLDNELWLVGGAAGLHIHTHLVHVHLVHIHLVLHALLHTHSHNYNNEHDL